MLRFYSCLNPYVKSRGVQADHGNDSRNSPNAAALFFADAWTFDSQLSDYTLQHKKPKEGFDFHGIPPRFCFLDDPILGLRNSSVITRTWIRSP